MNRFDIRGWILEDYFCAEIYQRSNLLCGAKGMFRTVILGIIAVYTVLLDSSAQSEPRDNSWKKLDFKAYESVDSSTHYIEVFSQIFADLSNAKCDTTASQSFKDYSGSEIRVRQGVVRLCPDGTVLVPIDAEIELLPFDEKPK